MTGRELIIYILANNLENEPVFKDGKFVGFITMNEAAQKMNVGIETVGAWVSMGCISSITINNRIYIPANFRPPCLIERRKCDE